MPAAAAKVGHEVEQLRVLLGEREEGAARLSSQLRAATRSAARQGASTSLSGCTAQAAPGPVPLFNQLCSIKFRHTTRRSTTNPRAHALARALAPNSSRGVSTRTRPRAEQRPQQQPACPLTRSTWRGWGYFGCRRCVSARRSWARTLCTRSPPSWSSRARGRPT